MAHFKGSLAEFNYFIGPCVRNLVKEIAKPYKKEIGFCENPACKSTEKLQFAHLTDKERPVLISKALELEGFLSSGVVDADLGIFLKRLKNIHLPFRENGFVLCESCHGKYDKKLLFL